MASVWAKWAAIAVFLVACVILVTAAPSNLYEDEEEFMEPAAAEQQEAYADEDAFADEEAAAAALTRNRRDSIGYSHGSKGHHGWYPPVGPVFTYVRTDPWANFQWGVRHKVYGSGWKVVPVLVRMRRGDEHGHGHGQSHGHHGWQYLGPVYTYAKTDHYANFKWGVRHHVGGHGWHRR